ncbi:MAG: hypothetical protein JWO39_2446 [Gemmatimonadetes bacterium]|nr:hypothetical protein [Gemmatimonadota bacterium]
MSRIDRVYIAAHRKDLRLTRICVASVRRWYPDIPVFLLKDETNGTFSTREIEATWNVRVWPTKERSFGWGFIKLEPLFDTERHRFLMLDSDIVFLGKVIDALERFDADFVVQEETQPPSDVPDLYFDAAKIRASFNPGLRDPEFTFNTGQYVGTSGLVAREDFSNLVEWSQPRRVRYGDMFNPGDQGVLNYDVLEKLADLSISVARTPFMKWGKVEMSPFEVASLDGYSPYPFVIHWAGLKHLRLRRMLRADILSHFEAAYYRRLAFGHARRWARLVGDETERWYRRAGRLIARARLS